MEFSDLGSHCEYEGCGRQDYLPFKCDLCLKMYCLEHKSYDSHQCSEFNKPNLTIPKKKKIKKNKCHVCNKNEIIELKCAKCNKLTCIAHRFPDNHECIKEPQPIDLNKNKCIIT